MKTLTDIRNPKHREQRDNRIEDALRAIPKIRSIKNAAWKSVTRQPVSAPDFDCSDHKQKKIDFVKNSINRKSIWDGIEVTHLDDYE